MSNFEEDQLMTADKVEDALDRVAYNEGENGQQERKLNQIHIQFQQRSARKCLTTIQGLPNDLDFKKLVRHFKKLWNCNGAVINHEDWGQVLQLQGDNRKATAKFLIEEGIATKGEIKIHGF